jgi:hypothetical protein
LQFAFKEFSCSPFRYGASTESVLIKHKLVDGSLNLPIQIKCTDPCNVNLLNKNLLE